MSNYLRLPSPIRRMLARRLARPAPPPTVQRTRRACIYKVDRLGDFVLALGAVRHLVNHYGADACQLVVSTVAEPLAAAEFPDVPRWVVPPTASGAWRELRPLRNVTAPLWAGEHFTDLICLRHARNLYRDASLTWLSAEHWRGLGPRCTPDELTLANRPVLPENYSSSATLPWSHELLAHRAVVELATGRLPDWEEMRPALRSVTANAGAAWVFCPFGHDAIRDYPIEHWITAWRNAQLPPAPVQLLGPGTRAAELAQLASRLRNEASAGPVEVLTGLSTPQFIARIAAARGVVTVDSAAAHLATALDKPAVIIMGGGHFGWFVPWGEGVKQRWLVHKLPCFGCNWECIHPEVRCLTELPAATVTAALRVAFAHG